MTQGRFRDDGRTITDFLDTVLVVCPQCGARAEVRPSPGPVRGTDEATARPSSWASPRRLTCGQCGLSRRHDEPTLSVGGPCDPYFGLPLVLQARCAGHVVWAYNRDHLDHLLSFVEASIRERPVAEQARPASLLEKMPAWFGAATHRAAISATLRTLRATLD